ncbi:Ada metal-binding domain-containing protein [Mammaliicoccus sciuri]|uniref:Ada metal-binding domain-containing protein n=1 Tax=Mammaliicoccus sciuri TaxID=1296 RepID=UPI0034DCDCBB
MYLTEKRWQDIKTNNKLANDDFVYAVKTTMIFCKPSCNAKLPNKENVSIYRDYHEAIDNGYRPCKKCNPTGQLLEDEEWVLQIKNFVHRYYHLNLTLDEICNQCHGSKLHLSRLFKQVTQQTIMQYLHEIRIEKSIALLNENIMTVEDISRKVGYKTTSHYIKVFKQFYFMTPLQFRKRRERDRNLI